MGGVDGVDKVQTEEVRKSVLEGLSRVRVKDSGRKYGYIHSIFNKSTNHPWLLDLLLAADPSLCSPFLLNC